MPPRVYLLRHGEALHNVLPEDHSIPDPVLTRVGELQALSVPSSYSIFFDSLTSSSTLLLTSPFRRTIQTTLIGFASVLPPIATKHPIPLMILPQLQECGKEPCDTGADLEETKRMFPNEALDWSECTQGWNSNEGFYEASEEKQQERAKWVRKFIRDRPEERVVVVSHHGFLRRITKTPHVDVNGNRAAWANAELREFEFVDEAGEDEEADLVKTINPVH